MQISLASFVSSYSLTSVAGLHQRGLQRHTQLHSCADIVAVDVCFDILVYCTEMGEGITDRFIAVCLIVSHQ